MEVEKTARMGVTIWELLLKNLNNDVLVEIFKHFDIFESTSAVGRFVEAWEKASKDQPLYQTLDFSMLKSDFIKTPILKPYVWVSSHSDTALYNFLLLALDLSQGNIKTLIFHYNLYLTNDQFIYTARRYVIMYTNFFLYKYNLIIVHFFPSLCVYILLCLVPRNICATNLAGLGINGFQP
jgi:hypothetical protein